ncbi:MAG: hypothetical protein MUC50_01390 [Myxococcota bacterium]|jgi:diacylglycerol kinase family enzyme|nr:hypothetical protein [Myxococcota bacterium]
MTARPAALVVVNPAARGGQGLALWASLLGDVGEHVEIAKVIETTADDAWTAELRQALEQGASVVIAAGGDGTVGTVADCLMGVPAARRPVLGAIGLGSSNDFHKPASVRAAIPLRIDPRQPLRRDVCRAELVGPSARRARHFVVSASAGFTAEANVCFNQLRGFGGFLKAHWTGGAIAAAAVATLLSHRNREVRLRCAGSTEQRAVSLSNLSLLKTPFISGSFRVDFPVASDDGLFGVALCCGLGKLGLMRVLADLSAGRFVGKPGREHFHTAALELEADEPFAVELDGEVFEATTARFEVFHKALVVCT